MFKRIRNLWELTNYKIQKENEKETLVRDDFDEEVEAEFFSEGTEEDFKVFEREEKGLKGLFGLRK